jgi:zinc transport system substrate-binding protein
MMKIFSINPSSVKEKIENLFSAFARAKICKIRYDPLMTSRIFSALFFALLCAFSPLSSEPPVLLVSVSPYPYFVKRIAGDFAQVELLVPAGASAHTYEPNAKEMMRASKAAIWFRIGEPFENKALGALQANNPSLITVNLWEGINLLHGECKEHHHCGADLHLWTSPLNAIKQSEMIAAQLIKSYPAHQADIASNLSLLVQDLKNLDREIRTKTSALPHRAIVVSHPSYGYFCRDYQFEQVSIEFEGRDPTSRQLTDLLRKIRQYQPKAIFTQPQYSDKAALLIAKEVDAKVIPLDPYGEDYLHWMHELIAKLVEYNGE